MLLGLLKEACNIVKMFLSELRHLLFFLFSCWGVCMCVYLCISLLIFPVLVLVYTFFLLYWTLSRNVNPVQHIPSHSTNS